MCKLCHLISNHMSKTDYCVKLRDIFTAGNPNHYFIYQECFVFIVLLTLFISHTIDLIVCCVTVFKPLAFYNGGVRIS